MTTYCHIIHDASASTVIFLIWHFDFKTEMLIKEADHEVKQVMDDAGEVKDLIIPHAHLIKRSNTGLHLNLEYFEASKALAEDEPSDFKLSQLPLDAAINHDLFANEIHDFASVDFIEEPLLVDQLVDLGKGHAAPL